MKISILTDSNWEAKLDHATRGLHIRQDFEDRNYGSSLQDIVIVLNCRDPSLAHKQRTRFSRSKAQLSLDVMLPLDAMARSSHVQRRLLLAKTLYEETANVLRKYSFESFDVDRFLRDFKESLDTGLLGPDADRYDHLCAQRAPQYEN